MTSVQKKVSSLYQFLLSDRTKEVFERFTLKIAILSFIVHLVLIYVNQFTPLFNIQSELLGNPIGAIYTPFSFILLYEVYLLIFYLPRSITTYISKQYEIISLIIIRRLFKDLSNLKLSSDWFSLKEDLQFTYDIIASLLLFYLLYWFYRLNTNRKKMSAQNPTLAVNVEKFISLKKIIAIGLVPILLVLAIYSLGSWSYETLFVGNKKIDSIKNINNVFFDEFFTVLIIVDVILLLVSFFYTDKFHKVIRNSGFVISTILIRLSFSVDGIVNTVLIVAAVVFGLLILAIHNTYEKHLPIKE
ncbi:hypothetical protein [Flagellimonas meridianipacifica]|uniref:Uncharacterized protein n=1 Tax=Flagellimonas meridianipacifica TaxID=1080225 RepID=A0A2T0MIH2_9FLAO|nr:hypothetical protein [Allomuricauda pacifica]PRX57306.1 hypothetical protein CLV81_1309 [Allomuricauda pacifica]